MDYKSILRQTLFLLLLCVIFTTGCAGGASPASPALDPVTAPADQRIYYDDFSSPESGWARYREAGINDYEDGRYRFLVELENFYAWSVAGQRYEDVRITVLTEFAPGAEQAELGVLCRYRDSENFYFFSITSTGLYGIVKMSAGTEQFLGTDDYQPSDAILSGFAINHLQAECVGSRLSLYVNGTHLITVQDTDYLIGDVGLLVGTFASPNANVYFDDFEVYQP